MVLVEAWQPKINLFDNDDRAEKLQEAVHMLANNLHLTFLTAALLVERGIDTVDKAKAFLQEEGMFCDPFLLPDMDKAAARLCHAIDCCEPIAVYGDYDVDGVTSVSLLMLYLRSMGLSPVSCIPSRLEEGYGMSTERLTQLAEQGIRLVVTVDTGVTALEEAKLCKALGMDLIVTDHHECRDKLPEAEAVVNPRRPDSRYPCPYLAGVGVAFKLVEACERLQSVKKKVAHGDEDLPLPAICEELVDLAALGTIGDVMPLIGENRQIVRYGLRRMTEKPRPALTALLHEAASEKGSTPSPVNAGTISYTLAPRINAAGRMEHADRALELFLAPDEEVASYAKHLCELNRFRQEEENRMLALVEAQLTGSSPEAAIVIAGDNFNSGIIGIVASRLTERYQKPVFLISFDGEIGKGSGRSPACVDLVKLLEGCADLLVKYGGHSMAAGLTIERGSLEAFRQRFTEAVKEAGGHIPSPRLYDLNVTPAQMTLRQAKELRLLEPFGAGNPQPLFCWKNAAVEQVIAMGEKHTKLFCRGEGITHQVLFFGQPREKLDLFSGDRIDLLVELSLNYFRGNTSVQLICREWKHSEGVFLPSEEELSFCRRLLSGGGVSDLSLTTLSLEDIPERQDCGVVYLYLRKKMGYGRRELFSLRCLLAAAEGKMSLIKLTLALRLLSDSGLLCHSGDDPLVLLLPQAAEKVDLTALPLYCTLSELRSSVKPLHNHMADPFGNAISHAQVEAECQSERLSDCPNIRKEGA